jgi:hypothetical protein
MFLQEEERKAKVSSLFDAINIKAKECSGVLW